MSESVRVRAPAKINLFLRVLERRPDGYHDLETMFQTVDLYDTVEVEHTREGVELVVEGPQPCPPHQNLAIRAAEGFRKLFSGAYGLRVRLTKRIPAGAGLGGGSSDAGAVLRCLASLAEVDPHAPEIGRLAADLGSDVPFFLSATALASATGRGEILNPLVPLPERWLVLAFPPVRVSTRQAFESLSSARSEEPPRRSGPMARPGSWTEVASLLENDFQDVIASAHPQVAESWRALERGGASGVLLSGSGSASFGLFESGPAAKDTAERLSHDLGWPFLAVRTLTAPPSVRRNRRDA